MARADPATQSNYLSARSVDLQLDWTIDWQKRLISGSVTHTVQAAHEDVREIVLDTSYLTITACLDHAGQSLQYELDERHPVLGQALHIHLAQPVSKGATTTVKVEYSTTPQCTTLGWLEADQTATGKYPFLYSQAQAIHMRSLAPCMDTPAVKSPYSATVRSYLPVLMSALRQSPPSEQTIDIKQGKQHTFEYRQPVPIPSYLIAIAAGEVAYKRIGKRTGVWADPPSLDKAHWEFEEDMEKFLEIAEQILPPYEFGDYDVLVLPASFPYGGMENANLTFLTPTLLAGDRSLVDVVAHELAHSWTGNNVGCKDWTHFWLNEGFTTYIERILVGRAQGQPARDFSYIIGRKSLQDSLDGYENAGTRRYQRLVIPYDFGEDPDDGFSTVPYDKGSNLLLHLERTVGGLELFLPYVKDYVQTYAGRSISTDDWKKHLFAYFGQQPNGSELVSKLASVDFDAWLNGEGTKLPVDMKYDTTLADAAYNLAQRWDAARNGSKHTFARQDLEDFTSNQVVVFLETLERYPALPADLLREMDQVYNFNTTGNAEIRLRWYNVALRGGGADFKQDAADWVITVGRMKMCRPTFQKLYKCDQALARKTFEAHKTFYHPIARQMIAKDLKVAQ